METKIFEARGAKIVPNELVVCSDVATNLNISSVRGRFIFFKLTIYMLKYLKYLKAALEYAQLLNFNMRTKGLQELKLNIFGAHEYLVELCHPH